MGVENIEGRIVQETENTPEFRRKCKRVTRMEGDPRVESGDLLELLRKFKAGGGVVLVGG